MDRVLSFDIGITNLAYCVLEKGEFAHNKTKHGYHIRNWGLIRLFPEDHQAPPTCSGFNKNQKACTHTAKFVQETQFFCNKHKIPEAKAIKKNKKKPKSPLQISERIYKEFQARESEFSDVDYVIVESQPVNKNPAMKSVQMLIFSYFAYERMRHNRIKDIGIIHAKRKEKLPDKDSDWKGSEYEKTYEERIKTIKDPYKRRKMKCLEYAKLCLKDCPDHRACLDDHTKQDDLCDAFLQGCVWFLG